MPQPDPQEPNLNPTQAWARTKRFGSPVLSSIFVGALAFAPSQLALPTARADQASHAAAQIAGQATVAGQTSPLDEERAAKEAAAEATASDPPEPAPVPQPPEQSSDEEALIELPVAPDGSGLDETEEPRPPDSDVPEGTAMFSGDTEDLESLRVLFAADEASIDAAAESELLGLAGYLKQNEDLRVVLQAHAGQSAQGNSQARRLSLSRALAIRTFLVDRGVPADRIFLRPLGSEVEDGPPDRVDILPLRP